MRTFKRFSRGDIYTTTYLSKKQWNATIEEGVEGLVDIHINTGEQDPYVQSIKHLYYGNSRENGQQYETYKQSSIEERVPLPENIQKLVVLSIPVRYIGVGVEPESFELTGIGYRIYDKGEGTLILERSEENVGTIIYSKGILFLNDEKIGNIINSYRGNIPLNISWKSTLPIHTTNYHCIIKNNELNSTQNTSAYTNEGELRFEKIKPYITTVGLYNENNELIAVAKTSQPILKTDKQDTTIHIKLDKNFTH